jgi:hypothetical protein
MLAATEALMTRTGLLALLAVFLIVDSRATAGPDPTADRLAAVEARIDACLERVQQAEARLSARCDDLQKRLEQFYAGRNPATSLDLTTPTRSPSATEIGALREVGLALESIWSTRVIASPFASLTTEQRQAWVSMQGDLAGGAFGATWRTAEQDIAGFAAGLRADIEALLQSDQSLTLAEKVELAGYYQKRGVTNAEITQAKYGIYVARPSGRAARTVIGALTVGAIVEAKSAIVEWRRQTGR